MALRVLFIGGTGNISLPCVTEAVAAGHEVSVFNRGARAGLPEGARSIVGDMSDAASYRELGRQKFDVVCQFIGFTPAQMRADIEAFAGNTGQYVYISSASAYQKPARNIVTTEKTPTVNPYWDYSQDKITSELLLKAASNLPWTIVRPSQTVRVGLPTMVNEGDVVGYRMLAGRPVIVAGDGTTPWTLTRSADFAVPFVRLFGRREALGEDFHITSDNVYTWDDIYRTIAAGLGVEADIVHVPTDTLVRYIPEWLGPLVGDKVSSAIFDNSKVKRLVGDFVCEPDLAAVLAEPIMRLRGKMAGTPDLTDDYNRLVDRIASEQRGLGA